MLAKQILHNDFQPNYLVNKTTFKKLQIDDAKISHYYSN